MCSVCLLTCLIGAEIWGFWRDLRDGWEHSTRLKSQNAVIVTSSDVVGVMSLTACSIIGSILCWKHVQTIINKLVDVSLIYLIIIAIDIHIYHTQFIFIKVRWKAGNSLAEENPTTHNPLDTVQSFLLHYYLVPRCLCMELWSEQETKQKTEWQRSDQLRTSVFHVYSHHHDGSSIRYCYVQRVSEILQA